MNHFRKINLKRLFCSINITPQNKLYYEIEQDKYFFMYEAILFSNSSKEMARRLIEHIDILNDEYIAMSARMLYDNLVLLDESFEKIIYPIYIQSLQRMTKDEANYYAELLHYVGRLKISKNEFWELAKEKFLKEKLYNYIPIEKMVDILRGMDEANINHKEMLDEIAKVLIKHRKALSENKRQEIKEIYSNLNHQNLLLFDSLENPLIDVDNNTIKQIN